jgi:photosystem II stability/assembly factor-like uncharacterized protein
MTGDPIERLRDADPARGGGAAPFEDVMDWIRRRQLVGSDRRRSWRPRWLHAVAPTIGVGVAAGLVAVVIAAVGAHHRAPNGPPLPRSVPSAQVPAPVSLFPSTGGMRGLVFAPSLFGAGTTLRASFVQCTNCRGKTTPPDAREVNWSATSTDAGRVWHVARERVSLSAFGIDVQQSPDVWASGFEPHAGDETFFVSHDSGRTYIPVSAPTHSGYAPITVGEGVVWTLGVRCPHYVCASLVLHGRAAGSTLTRTAAEPPGLPTRRAPTSLVVAGYGDHGYVSEGAHRRFYLTADQGRTWRQTQYPCPGGTVIRDLAPSGPAVWILCAPNRALTPTAIRRSVDSGQSWQTDNAASRDSLDLVAASKQVAWAAQPGGALQRTADGGRSWNTVFSGAGAAPAVDVQSTTHATVVAPATTGTTARRNRRTDLVAYQTTDGGAHWTHTVIHLPTR